MEISGRTSTCRVGFGIKCSSRALPASGSRDPIRIGTIVDPGTSMHILAKPFALKTLTRKLRDMLDVCP
jgi:hypothetical protein